MTQNEFINRDIAKWGEDYVYDLVDRGFVATYVSSLDSWKWLYIPDREVYASIMANGFTTV